MQVNDRSRKALVKNICGLIKIVLTVNMEGRSAIQIFSLVLPAVSQYPNEGCNRATFMSYQRKMFLCNLVRAIII